MKYFAILLIFFNICCSNKQRQAPQNQLDLIIKNTQPPAKKYTIKGGSCGESCLWTIFKRAGKQQTQKKINTLGGKPGRGLHSNELFTALKEGGITFKNISNKYSQAPTALSNIIKNQISYGIPVLIGVKVYPTETPAWGCDHFILLTGYNKHKQILIFNDFTNRRRIKIRKLLNTNAGYSIINMQKYLFAIAFP